MGFVSLIFQYGPQDVRPVHNDILIAKLRPGQVREILIRCLCFVVLNDSAVEIPVVFVKRNSSISKKVLQK